MGLADLAMGDYLERVAARQPAPGGGAVAATTVALAAALVAMGARFSNSEEVGGVVERADALRTQALGLADDDAMAYGAVLEARRLPDDNPERVERIAEALGRAADIPLAIAETAREVGALGAQVARSGNPNLRGDVLTGVLLADAAARSAARLVEINVRAGELDGERVQRSTAVCAELADAVRYAEDA